MFAAGVTAGTALVFMLSVATPAPAADSMGERVRACAACHGDRGRSDVEGYYPSIAGKPSGYLHQQLLNFRDGRRRYPVMEQMLAYLSDEYLREIADYYAGQTAAVVSRPVKGSEAQLLQGRHLVERGDPARGLPSCQGCHGPGLAGAEPSIPGLLGLPPDYLAAQLGAWKSGVRTARAPDCMADVARALSPEEIAAVTAWIASQPHDGRHPPARRRHEPLPMPCGGVQ